MTTLDGFPVARRQRDLAVARARVEGAALAARAALACVLGVGCTTTAPVADAPPVAATAPVDRAAPGKTKAPELVPPGLADQLRARERERAAAAFACVSASPAASSSSAGAGAKDGSSDGSSAANAANGACDPTSRPPAIDDAAAAAILGAPNASADVRRIQGALARAIIEEALVEGAAARSARKRSLTFLDGAASFMFDDARALFAQAKQADRKRWLASARRALEASAALDDEERALVERAAARMGLSRVELVARRAGVDERALRALAEGALSSTTSLLGPAAGDVTLLPEVPIVGDVRLAMEASKASGEPAFVAAIAAASTRPKGALTAGIRSRALVVELRRSALGVLAVIDARSLAERDALASRILDDAATEIVPGAALLLPADAGGAVVDRFVAALRAPAVARLLWRGASVSEVAVAWGETPPVDEQGFPEAFVEVARLLPELAR